MDRVSSVPTNYTLTSIVGADLNRDGKADVTGIFNSAALVYLSNGDGSSALGASYNIGPTQTTETALSAGDFNGDHLVGHRSEPKGPVFMLQANAAISMHYGSGLEKRRARPYFTYLIFHPEENKRLHITQRPSNIYSHA